MSNFQLQSTPRNYGQCRPRLYINLPTVSPTLYRSRPSPHLILTVAQANHKHNKKNHNLKYGHE